MCTRVRDIREKPAAVEQQRRGLETLARPGQLTEVMRLNRQGHAQHKKRESFHSLPFLF